MRVTVNENNVMLAIASCHPIKSSVTKLVKNTGMARNEINELIGSLKKIGYVNATKNNEVYLLEDGKRYCGIINDNIRVKTVQPKKEESKNNEKQEFTAIQDKEDPQEQTETASVLRSIETLASKLNAPIVDIANKELKGQVLTRLAELMSEDIAELLIAIKDDLERVTTK